MKKFLPLMVVACVALFCRGLSAQTDILTVIPEKSLLAAVAKDADVAEAHFREMAGKLSPALPKEGFIELMLQSLSVRRKANNPDEAEASEIDMKAPMAVVLVSPAPDVAGKPLGVVVKVGNYRKFLTELASAAGAAGPEVTPDGTDLLQGDKVSLFAAKFGPFAVVADAEYVVKTFKAEANKSLAASRIVSFKDACARNDVAVYANVKDMADTFAPQIDGFRQMAAQGMKGQPNRNGMAPEAVAKVLNAEIDFALKFAREIDAVCWGFQFSADGARITTQVQAAPDTTVAKLAGELKGGPMDTLQLIDAPVYAAGGWNIEPQVMKELQGIAEDFLEKSGMLDDKEGGAKAFLDPQRRIVEALSGQGAVFWTPQTEGEGLVHLGYIVCLKPGSDIRKDIRNAVQKSLQMNTFGGPIKIASKYEQGVETYRACVIDKVTLTFAQNPDVPEPPNMKQMLGFIEAMYGTEPAIYVTQVQDKMVYTLGSPTADAFKARLDRILDRKNGSLLQSEIWQSAVQGLPTPASAVAVFSVADLCKSITGVMTAQFAPEMNMQKTLDDLKFDEPSAIGVCLTPAAGGVVMHCNIPTQEMLNVKAYFQTMANAMMRNMFRNRPRPPVK